MCGTVYVHMKSSCDACTKLLQNFNGFALWTSYVVGQNAELFKLDSVANLVKL